MLASHSFICSFITHLNPQRNSHILMYFNIDLYFDLVIEEPNPASELCCCSYFKYCFFLVSLLGQREKTIKIDNSSLSLEIFLK